MTDFKNPITVNGSPSIVVDIAAASEQTVLDDTDKLAIIDTGVLKWSSLATLKTETQGGYGGNSMRFIFDSTTTDSDPGSGKIRQGSSLPFDTFWVDDLNADGGNVVSWLTSSLSAQGIKIAHARLFKESDSAIYVVMEVSLFTDASGYNKIYGSILGTNGSFANGDSVILTITESGDEGVSPGMDYTFGISPTDADPGNGNLKRNHSTFASVTMLWADDLDAYGNDITAWLATLDDSTNTVRGTLKITKTDEHDSFEIYHITGASTDAAGYYKLVVTPVVGAGTNLNGNRVIVSFSRAGDVGATGATGADGDAADIAAETSAASTDDTIDNTDLFGRVKGGVWVKTAWSNIKAKLLAAFVVNGTWTPVVTGGTTNPTITYTNQLGRYTVLFDLLVFYSLRVDVNTFSGGSGTLRVSTPFPCSNVNSADLVRAAANFNGVDVGVGAYGLHFRPETGQSYGSFQYSVDNAVSVLTTIADVAAGDSLIASGWYWK